MKRLSLFILVLLISGCASVKKPDVPSGGQANKTAVSPKQLTSTPQLENIAEDQLSAYEVKTGVIFGKTDFKGVLEKTYVKLSFEELENINIKFDLYIGDKARQQSFLWDVKPVQPGYFFLEMPVGKYRINSISIPVGSTQANEKMDITLEVLPEKVVYVGTLEVNGTKERLRLGGLPVIRPGFEYNAHMFNEKDEATKTFHLRYPNYSHEVIILPMQIHLPSNEQDYEG